jgi:hypothetical protein
MLQGRTIPPVFRSPRERRREDQPRMPRIEKFQKLRSVGVLKPCCLIIGVRIDRLCNARRAIRAQRRPQPLPPGPVSLLRPGKLRRDFGRIRGHRLRVGTFYLKPTPSELASLTALSMRLRRLA